MGRSARSTRAPKTCNGLVPQAHAQDRPLAGQGPDQLQAHARLFGRAWTRRNQHTIGQCVGEGRDLHLVIQPHVALGAEGA
jgi:hypothetical protein